MINSVPPPLQGTLLDQFLIRVKGIEPPLETFSSSPDTPFLSVITRTQGKRLAALREVFLCLAAQTCDDFEVVIVGHKMSLEARHNVETIIAEMPDFLHPRLRLLTLDHGNRTAPLNFGLKQAAGQYAVILDDDDLVLAHWVQTFKALAVEKPGQVLRAVAVIQDFAEITPAFGSPATRAISAPEKLYSSRFEFLPHFLTNSTPPMVFAFPVKTITQLGLCFDETLTTTEDWDFLMRAAMVCGVVSSPEITAVYRRWPAGETSQTMHDKEEWQQNYDRICAKLDAMPLVLPPGSAAEIRHLVKSQPRSIEILRKQLKAIHDSASWRLAAPLRYILAGFKPPCTLPDQWETLDAAHMEKLIEALYASTSWRITAPFRRAKRLWGQ